MPASWIRQIARAVLAILVLLLAIVVGLPYIASNRLVSDRIAVELGEWSGYHIRIGAPPAIGIWPRLRAVVTDVSASDWSDPAREPVGTAERIELELSPIAALRGEVVFNSALVVGPQIRLQRTAQGLRPPGLSGGGRLASAILEARETLAAGGNDAAQRSMPGDVFGTVEFVDGRIVADKPDDKPLASGISGRLTWPSLDGSASLVAKGEWGDDTVSLDLRSTMPMRLLAGGEAPFELSVQSDLGALSFEGSGRIFGARYLNGRGSLTTTQFERLVRLTGAQVRRGGVNEPFSLSAALSGGFDRLKLDQVTLELGGHRGTGAGEISLSGPTSRLSGSLDFETVSIGSVMDALMPLATARVPEDPEDPARPVDIDLRLSASRAQAGAATLSDAAASIQIKDRYAAFDILDAGAFGGSVQAGLRFDRSVDSVTGALTLRAENVEGGPFGSALGMTRLMPIGKGSIWIDLKGPGDDLAALLAKANGSIKAEFGAGAISKFDVAGFVSRARGSGIFPLDEIGDGTWNTEAIEIDATVADGIARLNIAEARSATETLWLSGVVSYESQGLALSGGLSPRAAGRPATTPTSEFFIGGTWSAPFVSPIFPNPFQARPGDAAKPPSDSDG